MILEITAAARTKLKKLQREEEAKKIAAASKSAAERSPHIKEASLPQTQDITLTFQQTASPHICSRAPVRIDDIV